MLWLGWGIGRNNFMKCEKADCPLKETEGLSRCPDPKCKKYRPTWLMGIVRAGKMAAIGFNKLVSSWRRDRRMKAGEWAQKKLKEQGEEVD